MIFIDKDIDLLIFIDVRFLSGQDRKIQLTISCRCVESWYILK